MKNFINAVKPTEDYPVNAGFCCVKGLNLDKQNTKFENPVLPILKDKKGDLKQISWKEAFNIFADRVKRFKKKMVKKVLRF